MAYTQILYHIVMRTKQSEPSIAQENEVLKYSPIIADMLAINTSMFTIEEIAQKIINRIKY